ncbi:hypothetical protein BKA82DRAFT_126657, partial [Pisolithus tinctorius]
YGSGIHKFHIFCDIFSIPEAEHLPASFSLLHSFSLWAASDPTSPELGILGTSVPFEPVAPSVAHKYLSAVRAWHIAQGWPAPLDDSHLECINWSLHGLENLGVCRHHPPHPPITIAMLSALKASLTLSDPFDACIWAMSTCAFFGMMHFGEVSVVSHAAFNPSHHLTRGNAFFRTDLRGSPYAHLDLPTAKTAKPGETQSVFLNEQGSLCPLAALHNMPMVTPASASDPLFSWRDSSGLPCPMVKSCAMEHINNILSAWGWGNHFGHSFCIGGASFFLAKKVDPEIIHIAGQWKSLAYQVYI